MLLLWSLLLALVLFKPYFLPEKDVGDDHTRHTVRLALLFYLPAALLMLRLDRPGWLALTPVGRTARLCWLLAWLAYVIHLGMAFHHFHGWSHADAVAHVEAHSGFGPGIWFSHLFTLAWTADVAWWCLRPASYADRPPRVGYALHSYMAFMIFNGTVVYETGLIRWAGVALFAALAAGLLLRRSSSSAEVAS